MTEKHALSGMEATVGPALLRKIQESKILLVGSGGIGCELLKNFALSGFRHVEAIDLDTIDVSNLNRQFLFRSQHVGMPKCHVACAAASKMAPDDQVKFIPRHGNVCDNSKFNVQYVSQFNLVLNALDNLVARRRVNRLCLAANVPLIEAGTTGYLGQVKVIDKRSNVACYECVTQETQKVYPICTIRSTPSMPVHTIVWAKELYKLLFGDKVEESMLYEDPQSEDQSTYMESILKFRSMLGECTEEDRYQAAKNILTHMFVDEINKQVDMGRFKTSKNTPTSLRAVDIEKGTSTTWRGNYNTASVWSIVECMEEFTCCLLEADPKTVSIVFDKDDSLAMRLVTAAFNLRSYVFQIDPIQSVYSAKGIAGNIIPAIATTNAIVAGLQVLQAFHVLRTQMDESTTSLADSCRYIDCLRNKMGRPGFYISSSKLDPPNPKCFVCRNATIPLTINVEKWNLKGFLAEVIKKKLGFEEPTVMIDGDIIYEEGDGADTALYASNMEKKLRGLPCGGIQNGTVIRIEDFSQDLEVDVCITHRNLWDLDEGETDVDDMKFIVGGEAPKAKSVEANGGVAKMPAAAKEADGEVDDEIEIVEMNGDADEKKHPAKRRGTTNADAGGSEGRKKLKPDALIVID
jgi:ubiquitin-like 1-activating enzyme E1 B